MSFPQLQKYKGKSDRLDKILGQIEFHLTNLLSEFISKNTSNNFFNYKQLVVKSQLSKEDVLSVLELLKSENVLIANYQFHCPETGHHIITFDSLDNLPEYLDCYHHDRLEQHETIYCDVEILFAFSPEFLEILGQVFV